MVSCVDDCCIFSKDKEKIDALLINLSKAFKLTDEGGVKYYLRMNVRKDPNGTITMRQPANFILKNVSLEHDVKKMQIKLDQFCQEPYSLTNSQTVQSFG